MFTGIVEELGEVVERDDLTEAVRFTVRGPLVTSDAKHGDSIAVNGVCLTVVDVLDGGFTADVIQETLDRSSLGTVVGGSRVNLERAAPIGSRLNGHIVQGHVDGVGRVLARTSTDNWDVVRISLPADLARYVVLKGSITVDGVSLTVSGIGGDTETGDTENGNWFEISVIPTTRELTTIGRVRVGDAVNLEVDVIAKYVERLMAGPGYRGTTLR